MVGEPRSSSPHMRVLFVLLVVAFVVTATSSAGAGTTHAARVPEAAAGVPHLVTKLPKCLKWGRRHGKRVCVKRAKARPKPAPGGSGGSTPTPTPAPVPAPVAGDYVA